MTREELLVRFMDPIPVLGSGFVQLLDVMGDDQAVVDAARISYGKGTRRSRADRHLLRYLLRSRHTSPFEQCEIKLRVKVPMDCWRQWIRHRTASVNEYSTRYSEAIDEQLQTAPVYWRKQGAKNKQGSEGYVDRELGRLLSTEELEFQSEARRVYEHRLNQGVAREQARKDLPLSTFTMAVWKIDLHNLLHFLSLRLDSHAQYEIRQYAEAIAGIVQEWVPWTWEAFEDYRLKAMTLTRLEIDLVKEVMLALTLGHGPGMTIHLYQKLGWEDRKDDGTLKMVREREEFRAKAEKLNIPQEYHPPSE